MSLQRFRVPMYVEAECLGTDEGDAANRIAAALRSLNQPGRELIAELYQGVPLQPKDGEARIFIRQAEHVGSAALSGAIRLVKGGRR